MIPRTRVACQAPPRLAPARANARQIDDHPPGRPAPPPGAIVALARPECPWRCVGGPLAVHRPRRRGWPARVHSLPPAVPVASLAATSPASTRTGHHVSSSRCGQSSGADAPPGVKSPPDAPDSAPLPAEPCEFPGKSGVCSSPLGVIGMARWQAILSAGHVRLCTFSPRPRPAAARFDHECALLARHKPPRTPTYRRNGRA